MSINHKKLVYLILKLFLCILCLVMPMLVNKLRVEIALQNNWVPRRNESRPTTIDQIHKEAAEEQLQQKFLMSLPMPKMDQQGQGAQRGKGAPKGGMLLLFLQC